MTVYCNSAKQIVILIADTVQGTALLQGHISKHSNALYVTIDLVGVFLSNLISKEYQK